MFLEGKDYLSIWEVAHRWAGFDPENSDQNNLPEQVRYFIHKLVEGYFGNELIIRRNNGYRVAREEIYLFVWNVNFWQTRMWDCLTEDRFIKKHLKNLFVRRRELLILCEKEGIDSPAFWTKQRLESNSVKPSINNRPKEEETDRLLCQAVAKTYWDIDSEIHPAHMVKAKAIMRYANGRQYKDPDTIKKWIAEVDPLKDQRKAGRPMDKKYLIDLETGLLRQS